MASIEDQPQVRTAAGVVAGLHRPGSAAFLGIPFAAAPVGERRFAAPVPAAPWEGVRQATAFGATPQRIPFGTVTTIPEPSIPGDETLNVNVFTPSPGDPDALLPVLVWTHGGGWIAGSPASPWYDVAAFNRDGVVVVVLSYRLGFDGWGLIPGAPANRGLLDQIAALEWVRDNIRGFGGDPGRVTVAGQSAGGGNVLTLLAAPAAQGLIHGAIAESAPLLVTTPAEAAAVAERFAALLGIENTLEGWRTIDPMELATRERELGDAFDDLATLGPAAVVQAALERTHQFLKLPFCPVIDGTSIPDLLDRFADDDSPVPLLIGTTAHEFAFPTPTPQAHVVDALRAAGAGDASLDAFAADIDRIGSRFAGSAPISLGGFRIPELRYADARSTGGAAAVTWRYDFRWVSPVLGTAAHCLEIPFAWDLLGADGVTEVLGELPPQPLADAMHAAWVRFVTNGDVGWPSTEGSPKGAMRFDAPAAYDPDGYGLERDLIDRAG